MGNAPDPSWTLWPDPRNGPRDAEPAPADPRLHGVAPDLGHRRRPGLGTGERPDLGRGDRRVPRHREATLAGHPHAAAALAWKCYSYWLALPAVLGYAAARRVPLVRPEAVRWKWSVQQPFLVLGLTGVEVAVLPSDPLAAGAINGRGAGGVRVVADEQALLAELRTALLDEHLTPLLDQVRRDVHVSARTFWGSLASGVAHGVSRAADVVPGSSLETADRGAGRAGRAGPGRPRRP